MSRRRVVPTPPHRGGLLMPITARIQDAGRNSSACRLSCGCEVRHRSICVMPDQHKCRYRPPRPDETKQEYEEAQRAG